MTKRKKHEAEKRKVGAAFIWSALVAATVVAVFFLLACVLGHR